MLIFTFSNFKGEIAQMVERALVKIFSSGPEFKSWHKHNATFFSVVQLFQGQGRLSKKFLRAEKN